MVVRRHGTIGFRGPPGTTAHTSSSILTSAGAVMYEDSLPNVGHQQCIVKASTMSKHAPVSWKTTSSKTRHQRRSGRRPVQLRHKTSLW